MEFKVKDTIAVFAIISVLCLTTESCDITESGKCLVKAAGDALMLLPKFITKPGPSCEKKDKIVNTLSDCLAVNFDDCTNPLQEEVQNLTISANRSMKSIESACKNSGCKDLVKQFANIKKCYNDTGLKAIFNSDTVFDLLNANNTNTSDTKLCKSANSFEICLEENSKTCPYLRKKFLKQVKNQDIANQAFDKCGIEITSQAVVHFVTAVLVITLASLATLLQIGTI